MRQKSKQVVEAITVPYRVEKTEDGNDDIILMNIKLAFCELQKTSFFF